MTLQTRSESSFLNVCIENRMSQMFHVHVGHRDLLPSNAPFLSGTMKDLECSICSKYNAKQLFSTRRFSILGLLTIAMII
jgi:hypothetical protein